MSSVLNPRTAALFYRQVGKTGTIMDSKFNMGDMITDICNEVLVPYVNDCPGQFYIVDSFDCPAPHMIAVKEGKKLNYIARNKAAFDGMRMLDARAVEDFGIDLEIREYQIDHMTLRVLYGKKTRDSIVTYRKGNIRNWQGRSEFVVLLDFNNPKED